MVDLKKEILDALDNGEGYSNEFEKIFEENRLLLDELDDILKEE